MMRFAMFLLMLCVALPVAAHKASDSYLDVAVTDRDVRIEWDIALRDLELAVGLDGNGDGAITWGELRARQAAITDYAQSRLALRTGDADCLPSPATLLVDHHSDGAYAALRFDSTCDTVPETIEIRYQLLFDLDAQHRGLARVTQANAIQALIFAPTTAQQTLNLGTTAPWRVLGDYLREGVHHIAIGYDHILFLASLLLPCVWRREAGRTLAVTRLRSAASEAVKIVTAFTLAHSITLALAALNIVTLPARLVESLIALSVLLVALNNLWSFLPGRAWRWAAGFGLVHGLGFASVLGGLGLPADAHVLALTGFNLGVEFGQLVIVVLLLPCAFLLRASAFYRRFAFPIGSLAIGALAFVWLLERVLDLRIV
jgi:hypothetical protein